MLLACVSSLQLKGHAPHDLGQFGFGGVFLYLPKFVLDSSCFLYNYISFFWPLRTDQHTHLGEASVNGPV